MQFFYNQPNSFSTLGSLFPQAAQKAALFDTVPAISGGQGATLQSKRSIEEEIMELNSSSLDKRQIDQGSDDQYQDCRNSKNITAFCIDPL